MKIQHSQFSPIIANIIRNSIEENFMQNGRFGSGILGGGSSKWQKSQRAIKQSGQTLQDTGQLAASIQVDVNATGGVEIGSANNQINVKADGYFEVSIGSNKKVGGVPLIAVHHFGGQWKVPITDRMRKYFWAMFKKKKDEKFKYMALTQKDAFNITMPARPVLVVQYEDLELINLKYLDWISKNLF